MSADKKKCKCNGGPCDCWAFAPLYGDGKGHSGATFPKPDQIVGKDDDGDADDAPANAAPEPAAPPAAPAAGGGAAPVVASKDEPEEDSLDEKLEAQMKSGLDGLNEGLDFLTRQIGMTPAAVVPVSAVDDPDDDPNQNPMIADDVGFAANPLDPLDYEPDCQVGFAPADDMDAINAELDAMDDADLDLEDPSADDILGSVLILLNAAMGF